MLFDKSGPNSALVARILFFVNPLGVLINLIIVLGDLINLILGLGKTDDKKTGDDRNGR